MTESRDKANREALRHLTEADPTLEDILPAGEAMPGMAANMVLTSGPRMAWADYTGGQREAVIGGALFEGLAADRDDALAKIDSGEIVVDGCHDHGAVDSLAGIYT
ncbi:MAG: DUF1116 domain-containing protein, partial [Rhodospirillaceae bacterium]|nr:DUF1116 domain-containing protein [Rhodospirillaceae bacterium]